VGVVIDPKSGNLYGATNGGGTRGCGVVYELTPPSVNDGNWSETVLYNFACGEDGSEPYSALIRDSAGRLYGTTLSGGSGGSGVVFMLTPTKSGPWAETVLHRFYGGQISNTDGGDPIGPLAIDSSGAVYGATRFGGEGCPTKSGRSCGTIFQLVPPVTKGGQWTENLLYQFTGEAEGASPMGGVMFNGAGALYGTTQAGGKEKGGTVFSLSPPLGGVGNWTIASFPLAQPNFTEYGVLLLGNDIFGASTYGGANRMGMVFELQQ